MIQMLITMIATVMIMLAYFLVLYGVVGLIQDKRFFSTFLSRVKGCCGFTYVRVQHEIIYVTFCYLYSGLCCGCMDMYDRLNGIES